MVNLLTRIQVIEPKCTETKKTVKRFVTETEQQFELNLAC